MKYRVVFLGDLTEDKPRHEIIKDLSSLLDLSTKEVIDQFIRGEKKTLISGISKIDASEYCDAIRRAGANCLVDLDIDYEVNYESKSSNLNVVEKSKNSTPITDATKSANTLQKIKDSAKKTGNDGKIISNSKVSTTLPTKSTDKPSTQLDNETQRMDRDPSHSKASMKPTQSSPKAEIPSLEDLEKLLDASIEKDHFHQKPPVETKSPSVSRAAVDHSTDRNAHATTPAPSAQEMLASFKENGSENSRKKTGDTQIPGIDDDFLSMDLETLKATVAKEKEAKEAEKAPEEVEKEPPSKKQVGATVLKTSNIDLSDLELLAMPESNESEPTKEKVSLHSPKMAAAFSGVSDLELVSYPSEEAQRPKTRTRKADNVIYKDETRSGFPGFYAFFNSSKRASRLSFFIRMMCVLVMVFFTDRVLNVVLNSAGKSIGLPTGLTIIVSALVLFFLSSAFVTFVIQRLRDLNRSPSLAFLLIIPLLVFGAAEFSHRYDDLRQKNLNYIEKAAYSIQLMHPKFAQQTRYTLNSLNQKMAEAPNFQTFYKNYRIVFYLSYLTNILLLGALLALPGTPVENPSGTPPRDSDKDLVYGGGFILVVMLLSLLTPSIIRDYDLKSKEFDLDLFQSISLIKKLDPAERDHALKAITE